MVFVFFARRLVFFATSSTSLMNWVLFLVRFLFFGSFLSGKGVASSSSSSDGCNPLSNSLASRVFSFNKSSANRNRVFFRD